MGPSLCREGHGLMKSLDSGARCPLTSAEGLNLPELRVSHGENVPFVRSH